MQFYMVLLTMLYRCKAHFIAHHVTRVRVFATRKAFFCILGVLDDATVRLLSTPRCGHPDHIGRQKTGNRRKRYALSESRL